jgi:hypothetical protein
MYKKGGKAYKSLQNRVNQRVKDVLWSSLKREVSVNSCRSTRCRAVRYSLRGVVKHGVLVMNQRELERERERDQRESPWGLGSRG